MEAADTDRVSSLLAIGRTGSGKSALGNTLFCGGSKERREKLTPTVFEEQGNEATATTISISTVRRETNGRAISYTDTPGVFGDHQGNLASLSRKLSEGVTAIVLVVSLPGVFGSDDGVALRRYYQLLCGNPGHEATSGDDVFARVLIAFTHNSDKCCRTQTNLEVAESVSRKIKRMLVTLGVSELVAQAIPFVLIDNVEPSEEAVSEFWNAHDTIATRAGWTRLYLKPSATKGVSLLDKIWSALKPFFFSR